MAEDAKQKFADYVLSERDKGNIVFAALDDYAVAPLDEFIRQPADGILYDLNRSPEVVLTFIEDRKWVNDFAVSMVIKRLRELCDVNARPNSEIIKFCAEEVERQGRGPIQVAWMVEAWMFFIDAWAKHWPWFEMLQKAGSLVEHQNPPDKWRQVNVRVGLRVCPNVAEVPRLMDRWGDRAMVGDMTPEDAYRELMEIHPFADGNGRVGKMVYNALKGTLDKPTMPPNFFNCANP